ncbi:hypothetical protein HK096_008802 [Nowakowskiella sp. JEL0078]|nr:hypothetical protein HK096_008802 [Nowakowskiella sp. JEL0078]
MPTKESVAAAASSEDVKQTKTKRVLRPDNEAQKKEISDINDKIKALQKKQAEVQEKIKGNSDIKGSFDTRRQKFRTELDAKIEEKKAIQIEYTRVLTQIKAIQAGIKKKVAVDEVSNSKDKHGYKSVEDIDKAIKDLDKQLVSGGVTLTEEKRIVSDISGLRKIKKTLESATGQQASVDTDKKSLDVLRKELEEITAKRDDLNKQIDATKDQLKDLSSSQNEEMGGHSELISTRNSLRSEIDAEFENLRELRKNQKIQWDEFKISQEQENQRYRALKKAQQKEEALQRFERRLNEELENADVPAFTEEINSVSALIDYLKTLIKSGSTEITTESTSANSSVEDKKPEGAVVFKRKDEDFLVMGSPKKKGGKKAETSKKSLKFDLEMIQQFSTLQIDIPSTHTDVERAITDLEAKRTHFKENQAVKTAENKANVEKKLKELKAQIAEELGEEVDEVKQSAVEA